MYASNFQRCGSADKDLALLEGLVLTDLEQMGISKRAHLEKLLRAMDRLTKLLLQGRSPEGKSMALIKTGEIRDLVSRLPKASIEATLFFPRLVLGDKESFWKQLTESKLDPKHESSAGSSRSCRRSGTSRSSCSFSSTPSGSW